MAVYLPRRLLARSFSSSATEIVQEAAPQVVVMQANKSKPEPYKVIQPVFQWTEEPFPAKRFTIDCSNKDLSSKATNTDLVKQIRDTYEDCGLVHLTNTGLTCHQQMRQWATSIVTKQVEYQGGANPRKEISKNVYDVGAPNSAWLHYHHEMAYLRSSPKYLSLWCKHCPDDKGWTYVSDNLQATEAILETPFGQKLKEKNVCYVRNLTDKEYHKDKDQSMIYNHWQDSFMVEDPDLVEPIAAKKGLKIEWEIRGKNRFLKTKYYVSAYEYFPLLDKNLLYSSVADDWMWFDSWPGIDSVHVDERPLRLTYGDDSDMTQQERQEFVDIHDRFGFPIKWKAGDVGIMCNYRWLHGRPGFEIAPGEKRELGVLIGETFDRIGHVDGKW